MGSYDIKTTRDILVGVELFCILAVVRAVGVYENGNNKSTYAKILRAAESNVQYIRQKEKYPLFFKEIKGETIG